MGTAGVNPAYGQPSVWRNRDHVLRATTVAVACATGLITISSMSKSTGEAGLPIELQPQGTGDRADSVLDRGIARSSFICLESRDRADVDDVTVWRLAQQRDARPGDEHHAQHVDLPHPDPVRVDRLGDRRQAEGAAGVVDEDVDAPKALAYFSDETLHAVSIGHVKLEGEAGLTHCLANASHAARSTDHDIALASERRGSGCADSRRGSSHHRYRFAISSWHLRQVNLESADAGRAGRYRRRSAGGGGHPRDPRSANSHPYSPRPLDQTAPTIAAGRETGSRGGSACSQSEDPACPGLGDSPRPVAARSWPGGGRARSSSRRGPARERRGFRPVRDADRLPPPEDCRAGGPQRPRAAPDPVHRPPQGGAGPFRATRAAALRPALKAPANLYALRPGPSSEHSTLQKVLPPRITAPPSIGAAQRSQYSVTRTGLPFTRLTRAREPAIP